MSPAVEPVTAETENDFADIPPKVKKLSESKAAQKVQEVVIFAKIPEDSRKVHFGILTATPLSEQVIRDMKLVEAPVIYMNPR